MGEFISVLTAVFFAFSAVLVKKGIKPNSEDNGAFLSILLTLALALVFFVVQISIASNPIEYFNGDGILWFILAGIFSAFIGRSFKYISIKHIGAVRNSAIIKLNPLFTVFIAVIMIGETITIAKAVGMLFIFSGVFFASWQSYQLSDQTKNRKTDSLIESGSNHASTSFTPWRFVKRMYMIGILFAPLSALGYALGNVYRKKGMLEIPDPYFGVILGMLVGIMLYLVLSLFNKQIRKTVAATFAKFNPTLFYAGILMSLGQISLFMAMKYIEVSRVALITTIEAVFTLCISLWIFKTRENVNFMTVISIILTIVGTVVIILF